MDTNNPFEQTTRLTKIVQWMGIGLIAVGAFSIFMEVATSAKSHVPYDFRDTTSWLFFLCYGLYFALYRPTFLVQKEITPGAFRREAVALIAFVFLPVFLLLTGLRVAGISIDFQIPFLFLMPPFALLSRFLKNAKS